MEPASVIVTRRYIHSLKKFFWLLHKFIIFHEKPLRYTNLRTKHLIFFYQIFFTFLSDSNLCIYARLKNNLRNNVQTKNLKNWHAYPKEVYLLYKIWKLHEKNNFFSFFFNVLNNFFYQHHSASQITFLLFLYKYSDKRMVFVKYKKLHWKLKVAFLFSKNFIFR